MSIIKGKIKDVYNSGRYKELEVYIKKVSNYKNVSFDMFDTLIKRIVDKPEDIFFLMESNNHIKIDNFKKKRIAAEKKAREVHKEVNIEMIYDYFYGISEEQKKDLINFELKIEKDNMFSNEIFLQLFKKCIELNKNVYIITDIYFNRPFIEEILSKNGIYGYKNIFISCECGKTKANGELFEEVLRVEKIKSDELIHIGDSWNSDYKKPKSMNISAIHIPTNYNFKKNIFSMKYNNYLNNFIKYSNYNNNSYYSFGFEKFGPFLWGFSKWIFKELKEKNIKNVYFLSRDGWIMKNAFDLCNIDNSINTEYIEVSRRSLRVPVIWMNSSLENIISMISPSKYIKISSFFEGVGLEIVNYEDKLLKHNFNKNTVLETNKLITDYNFLNLYKEIESDIIEISKKEYKAFKEYLIEKNICGKFAIVDIGWAGSMQRYLRQTLDKLKIESEITGLYIGIADYYKRNEVDGLDLDLNGYLFDMKKNINDDDKRKCFVGLFELLFLERAGSVKNYELSNNEVIVNRFDYEYIINNEPTNELLCIKKIQDGALSFVDKASRNEFLNKINYSSKELFQGIEKTGVNPNKKDINMFADFNFLDEGVINKLAKPRSVIYYLFHISELKKDFIQCRWKIGFMKRIFKLRFPYKKIFNYLLKFK